MTFGERYEAACKRDETLRVVNQHGSSLHGVGNRAALPGWTWQWRKGAWKAPAEPQASVAHATLAMLEWLRQRADVAIHSQGVVVTTPGFDRRMFGDVADCLIGAVEAMLDNRKESKR